MREMTTASEVTEAINRPDAIWLSLKTGENTNPTIMDWEDIDVVDEIINRDKCDNLIVVGIPIYPNAEKALENATRYVFNVIEINEKIAENKKLLESIGK